MTAARTTGWALELSALKSNTRAERFYARLDFAKMGALTHHIRMRWPIAEEAKQSWSSQNQADRVGTRSPPLRGRPIEPRPD